MKILNLVLAGFIFSALVSGCFEESGETELRESSASVTNLAVVGGMAITATEVKDTVLLNSEIYNRHRINLEKLNVARKVRLNALAMKITPQLVEAELLDQELMVSNVNPTAESDARVLEKYSKILHKRFASPTELSERFGDYAKNFLLQFKRESRFEQFLIKNPITVSGDEERTYFQNASNRIRRCELINKRAKHRIGLAYNRLRDGEDWNSVATNVSEDAQLEASYADNWRDWITITQDKAEPLELQQALTKMKVGDFTPPMQSEEGLIIVRLSEKDGDLYSLARILVRNARQMEIPSAEEVHKRIYSDKRKQLQQNLVIAAKKHIKIEYPLGKKFKYEIWPVPKKAKRSPRKKAGQ